MQRRTPWGTTEMVAGDMSNRELAICGPAGRMGVIYQRMREVICVDPITGETIWSRDGLPAAAQLLGDEQVVIVAPPNGGDAVLLSAVDGHLMGRQPIESIAQRWLNWGPNTIATKNVGANIELRLYNVATGEVLWEDAFPQGTQGSRAGGDEFAILQKDGKFEIRSLVDGSVKISSTLSPEPQLAHLQVIRSDNDYIVVPSEPQSARSNGTISAAPSGGYSVPVVNGRIYAFDRESGAGLWQSPATVEDYSLPLGQPKGTPVLLLLRNERLRDDNGRSRQTYSGVGLDRRDGRLIFHEESTPGSLSLYEITADPEKNEVQIAL
ncbi:MAG: PQQ-binding-like beta-propeller repeat protein, partial [Planctomycetales bacterium]|nr:PQQ-binding-like beta-propeller repeat protein [Planctomycetales bacterium]